MGEYAVSVVVPTMNNQDDLTRCVSAVAAQTSPPLEVIIVNDGTIAGETERAMRDRIEPETDLAIIGSDGPPGLSTAKNTGAEAASGDVVLYLDDDAVVGERYVETLRRAYREHDAPDLAGIGGFDREAADGPAGSRLSRLYDALFWQRSDGWTVNPVGFQSSDAAVDEPVQADWIPGYSSSYRREVLLDHPFVYWNGGREALEDVEIAWRLRNEGYRFVVDPRLEVEHDESGYADVERLGRKAGRNRVRMFREHAAGWTLPLFLWCALGQTLKRVYSPLLDSNGDHHWPLARGLVVGYASQLLGR